MFKKLAVIVAASSMLLVTTAAQASSASALSLRNAPAVQTRASTAGQKESKLEGTPLFAIIGIVAVVALLEVTGVINIFGDDEPDSN
jgi:hypothetical protein